MIHRCVAGQVACVGGEKVLDMFSLPWGPGRHHAASCCGAQVLDSPVLRAVVIFSLSSVGKKLLLVIFHGSRRDGKENPKRALLEGPPTTGLCGPEAKIPFCTVFSTFLVGERISSE